MTDLWQWLKQRQWVRGVRAYLEKLYVADSSRLTILPGDRMFHPLRKKPSFIAPMNKLGFKGGTP